jgi:WD40 repeat protein
MVNRRGGNVNKKLRFVCPAILMIVSFSACVPPGAMPIGSPSPMPEQGTLASTDTLATTSTQTILPTITNTITNSATPADYKLLDWREPTEVITPENMDRVEQIGKLIFHNEVYGSVWSPDGSKIGILAGAETYILDSSSLEKLINKVFDEGMLAFSADGRILQIGMSEYDPENGEVIYKASGFDSPFPGVFTDIAFSPDGKYRIVSGTSFSLIKYLKKDNARMIVFGRDDARNVSISTDSMVFAINYGIFDYTEIVDPYKVNPIRKLQIQGIQTRSKPIFAANGSSLFLIGRGTWDGTEASFLEEWEYNTGRPLSIQILPSLVKRYEPSMDASPKSEVIAFGTENGGIYLIKYHDCKGIKVGQSDHLKTIVYSGFRLDGKLLATVEDKNGGIIDLWGIPTSNGETENSTPTVTAPTTTLSCPHIPMTAESQTPDIGWIAR